MLGQVSGGRVVTTGILGASGAGLVLFLNLGGGYPRVFTL